MSLLARRAMTGIAEVPKAPWTNGDISIIKKMLDDAQAGKAVDFSDWHIGDARPVTFHARSYNLVLAHRFTGAPASTSAAYAFNGTAKYPSWAVVCIPQGSSSQYSPSPTNKQKYFSGALYTEISHIWTYFYNTQEGKLFKPFKCVVGIENDTSYTLTTGTYTQSVNIAALACKEVGVENRYNRAENAALIPFSYFYNSAAHRKIGSNNYYWLRSPAIKTAGRYYAYEVNSTNGSVDDYGVITDRKGVVWFGCI